MKVVHARIALRRLVSVSSVASLFIGVCARPTVAGYFPERPPAVAMHTMRGVLESYSTGMGIGVIEIRVNGRLELFRPGENVKVDGHDVDCAFPRRVSGRWVCAKWPASVVFGRSIVSVHFWVDYPRHDKYGADTPDAPQRVTDQIDLMKT